MTRAELDQSNDERILGPGKVTKSRHSNHNKAIADYVDSSIVEGKAYSDEAADAAVETANAYTDGVFEMLSAQIIPIVPTDSPLPGILIYRAYDEGTYTNFLDDDGDPIVLTIGTSGSPGALYNGYADIVAEGDHYRVEPGVINLSNYYTKMQSRFLDLVEKADLAYTNSELTLLNAIERVSIYNGSGIRRYRISVFNTTNTGGNAWRITLVDGDTGATIINVAIAPTDTAGRSEMSLAATSGKVLVELVIDYSLLPVNASIINGPSNIIFANHNIRKQQYAYVTGTPRLENYLENPLDTFNGPETSVINAIKGFKMLNVDNTKRYRLTIFSTLSTGGNAWRITIVDADTGTTIGSNTTAPTIVNNRAEIVISGPSVQQFILLVDYSSLSTETLVLNSGTSKIIFSADANMRISYPNLINKPSGDEKPIVYSNNLAKFSTTIALGSPAIVVPANIVNIQAKFSDGSVRYFSIVAGTYQFTANYQVLGIDLTATPPADGGTVTLITKVVTASTGQLDPNKFIRVASIWLLSVALSDTTRISFEPDFDRYVVAAWNGMVDKTHEQQLTGNPIQVTPFDMYNKVATVIGTATVTRPASYAGFTGPVHRFAGATATSFIRLLEKVLFKPDPTKPLYIEFDYLIVSGAWSMKAYYVPYTSLVYHPDVVLQNTGVVTRKRYEITAAQLATIPAGSALGDYFLCSSDGELIVGNIEIWQGAEIVDHVKAMDVRPDVTAALNADILYNLRQLPAHQQNITFMCDSTGFTNGNMQTGFVGTTVNLVQFGLADTFLANQVSIINASTVTMLTGANNKKYGGGVAARMEGANAEFTVWSVGNEISIAQGIERSNLNASEIDIYIDGTLYKTINNWNNAPLGTDTVSFTGDGTTTKFDLGRCFTYSHAVTVDGVAKVGGLYTGGSGAVIPGGSDYLVIRKYGNDAYGNPAVHHFVWFKVAPANGADIDVSFSYGEEISYERTTIGKTADGTLESAYGDGDVSFDPSNPASVSSGLDYRYTDDRAVTTLRFPNVARRQVRIKIKGLYNGATGTPYFIFNFLTNRFFKFKNAGIGGWTLQEFNSNSNFNTNYKKAVEDSPDYILVSLCNNDDHKVKGQKAYTVQSGLTLTQLRSKYTFPAKSMSYSGGSYTLQRWAGKIAAVTERSVTLVSDATHLLTADPVPGDYVCMGTYYSNNREYVVRKVASYNSGTKTITFDKPISTKDVVYDDLQDLVGLDIMVRDMTSFSDALKLFVENIRKVNPQAKIATICNPLPNLLLRELWPYDYVMSTVAAEIGITNLPTDPVYDYQYMRADATGITIDASTLVLNPDTGFMEVPLTGLTAGTNYLNFSVLVNGVDVYGKDAHVYNGQAYSVDASLSTTGVNMDSTLSNQYTYTKQKSNQKPPYLVFRSNWPVSGTITIKWASLFWSIDSVHLNDNSPAAQIYGQIFLYYLLNS